MQSMFGRLTYTITELQSIDGCATDRGSTDKLIYTTVMGAPRSVQSFFVCFFSFLALPRESLG